MSAARRTSLTDSGLRGDDTIHCARTARLDEQDLVAATGDRRLRAAGHDLGIATHDPADP